MTFRNEVDSCSLHTQFASTNYVINKNVQLTGMYVLNKKHLFLFISSKSIKRKILIIELLG